MKSLISLYLFFLFTFFNFIPRADQYQLSKLGEIIKHFRYHQYNENYTGSFRDFLLIHFLIDSEHYTHSNHSHKNLPTFENQTLLIFDLPFLLTSFCSLSVFDRNLALKLFFLNNLYEYEFIMILFSPPKIITKFYHCIC